MSDKRKDIVACAVAALLCVLAFYGVHVSQDRNVQHLDKVKVGFVLDGDESTPYSYNFMRAINDIERTYGEHAEVLARYNVSFEEGERVISDLADAGCNIVFTNSSGYGEAAKACAGKYPDVQFCAATCDNANVDPVYENYHTFMGEIYQGRYVAGKVAGMKLREMIENGQVQAGDVWIGYVGAFPYPEVISGYTAFFLGARSECPTVRMRVKYANTWSSYSVEKQVAKDLIDEGCVLISQHTNTVGPAVACEEANLTHPVYHVGYNQDMIEVASASSLTGSRINWAPYCTAAVQAVMSGRPIEDVVAGHHHGNDVGDGFAQDWITMLPLNDAIAPDGARDVVEAAKAELSAGTCHVFQGDYLGVDPEDPTDTWDLNVEYPENANSSAPSFHYILQDVIVVEGE